MRLDKFLKVSRLIPRRAVAQDVLQEGLVTVNGRPAKPATRVKPGDVVVLSFGHRTIKFEVVGLAEHVTAKEAPGLYRLLED
ncbi:RNA-binding S4 domain-containing protein [Thermodesulfitimonas autotrophica]|uniref:RNA-binding S4 domain-containing protein n=1 Tax=Thermodesulfitimonas autotrophica TaxID=1894989 RepID=UPI002FE15DC9